MANLSLSVQRPLPPIPAPVSTEFAANHGVEGESHGGLKIERRGSGMEVLDRTLAGLEDFNLTGQVNYRADSPYLAGGGYGDIRIGDYIVPGRGRIRVAVKCIRLYLHDSPEIMKLIEREVRLWSKLKHPNILPLLGYAIEQHGLPALISEFMDNGTVLKYVQAHPDCDVIPMVVGLAEGISYLHDSKIIHSDIKSDNALVSRLGEPLICDFGISRLITVSQTMAGHGVQPQSSTVRGSARWMSPELLLPPGDHAIHSKESDIWAFGMTVYELLARKRPYNRLASDPQVITSIICGDLPRKPRTSQSWPESYHILWAMCKEFWSLEPEKRPSADDIVLFLRPLVYPKLIKELPGIGTVSERSDIWRGNIKDPSRGEMMMLPTRRPTYDTFADMGVYGSRLESDNKACTIM